MSAKHTPGPWKVRKAWDGDGYEVYPVRDEKPGLGVWVEVALVKDVGASGESARKTARLIAAAPELLAACEEYISIMHYPEPMDVEVMMDWQREHIKRVLDAIAKAKGGAA